MPIYAYKCFGCNHQWEVLRLSIKEHDTDSLCPECGEPGEKVIGPVAAIFRGPGFYCNDRNDQ